MKLATMIATVLVSASAFAGTVVYHDYDAVLGVGGIQLNNACVTATEVKTINPQTVCTKLVPVVSNDGEGMTRTDWVCQKWEKSHLSSSRTFSRTFCAKWAREGDNDVCVAFGSKTEFMPNPIKIATVTSNGEYDNFPGVVSYHTFPACR